MEPPDAAGRVAGHRYADPLDHVWLATAARIGLGVVRSPDAFAATDGAGTLVIGTPETLDPDDCLAQMILHELCHALVEGPGSLALADWGLSNVDSRDELREHACLRVQAALVAPHGLRWFLAPTTDYRAYYDGLPPDPLAAAAVSLEWRAIELATAAHERAGHPPWAPHLQNALAATAAIARTGAAFSREPDAGGLSWLYEVVDRGRAG